MTAATRTKVIQWLNAAWLGAIGTLAFMVLAGDEDPNHPMGLFEFFAIKAAALAVCWGVYKIGAKLEAKGLTPPFKDPEDEMED
jgi:uncharacterized membrane protein